MDKGSIHYVDTNSVNFMYMYGTTMLSYSYSRVFMGQKENKFKGAVGGYAVSTGLIRSFGEISSTTSLTGFATKPFQWNERLTISPMLAVSNPFVTMSLDTYDTTWNTDIMIIGGTSFSYMLSQRFGLNLGVTAIEATIDGFPTLVNYMIGGRFTF